MPKLQLYKGNYIITPSDYALNFDWVRIIAETNIEILNKFAENKWLLLRYKRLNFVFQPMEKGSRQFRVIYKVLMNNIEVATIEMISNNQKMFKSNEIAIKLSNFLLYTNRIKLVTRLIFSMFEVQKYKFTEVHLALDNVNVLKTFVDAIVDGRNFGIKYLPKQLDSPNGRQLNSYIYNVETQTFMGHKVGTKAGGMEISIYNKTQELRHTQKEYIKEYWSKVGIQRNQIVYRFEIRLTSKYLKKYVKKNSLELFDVYRSLTMTILNKHICFFHKEKPVLINLTGTSYLEKLEISTNQSNRVKKMVLGYYLRQYFDKDLESDYWLQLFCNLVSELYSENVYDLLYIREKCRNIFKFFTHEKTKINKIAEILNAYE